MIQAQLLEVSPSRRLIAFDELQLGTLDLIISLLIKTMTLEVKSRYQLRSPISRYWISEDTFVRWVHSKILVLLDCSQPNTILTHGT